MSFCPSERHALKYCGKCQEIYFNFFATEDRGKWSVPFFPLWQGFLALAERVLLGHCVHCPIHHPPASWMTGHVMGVTELASAAVSFIAAPMIPKCSTERTKNPSDYITNYNVFHRTAHTAFSILNDTSLLEGGREIIFMAQRLRNEYSAKFTTQGCNMYVLEIHLLCSLIWHPKK